MTRTSNLYLSALQACNAGDKTYYLDNFSRIHLYDESGLKTIFRDTATKFTILEHFQKLLLAASVNRLKTFDLTSQQVTTAITVPNDRPLNSISSVAKDSSSVYLGTSSGYVYCYKFDQIQTPPNCFLANKAAVYNILVNESANELITTGEDGAVNIFDLRRLGRDTKHQASFSPAEVAELNRPRMGCWVNTLETSPNDPDWLVVGGGPRLALWNKRMRKHVALLEPSSHRDLWFPDCALLTKHNKVPVIVSGGNSNVLYAWDYAGKMKLECQLDPSIRHINSLIKNDHNSADLLVAGVSRQIFRVSDLGSISGRLDLPLLT